MGEISLLTEQEVFDRGTAHIRAQGCGAKSKYGCYYRTVVKDKKLSCIVGGFIPDELYDKEMEGAISIGRMPLIEALITVGVIPIVELSLRNSNVEFKKRVDFLRELQRVHDDLAKEIDVENPLSLWESGMRIFAQKYDLVYTPPTV